MPISDFEHIIVAGRDDQDELLGELLDLIPPSWTSTPAKQRSGVYWTLLSAIAAMLAVIKKTTKRALLELRVLTATNGSLDIMAEGYFGLLPLNRLLRKPNETDTSYRKRILAELLRERVTVNGIIKAVEQITGAAPVVFEPFNVLSTASWGGIALDGISYNSDFTFAAYGSPSVDMFNAPNNPLTTSHVGPHPNLGIGAFGDLAVKYTFFVDITNNPDGALKSDVESVIDRVRPIGVRGIVLP